MMMRKGKGKNTSSGKLLPNSWRIVSSCLKTVSTNASTVVRSAVAAAISYSADDHKDQVTWAGFDKLEFCPSAIKHVLLVGYANGFQVIDVEDASNFSELVSRRDCPVTFLQILPAPLEYDVKEEISSLHPILLVVAGDEDSCQRPGYNHTIDSQSGNSISPSNTVRFYSFRSNRYVKVMSFPSPVLMVRSSHRIIAVGLKSQICCIDTHSLEKKFSVSTYPVPQFEGQGQVIDTGYGPMAVGPRWLAYAPENPYVSVTGRLSPKNLNFPGVSPSTSPGNGSLMAHYAMQSGKQFAIGIMNLGDMGYKTLSKYCPDFLPDVAVSSGWNGGKLTAHEMEKAGMVVIKDVISTAIVSQFRAHTSPISALCFDPSGTLLVTASIHGNNINIFRIMPSPGHSESSYYDWNSSHMHLYKLYRGVTSAIIRDICFSHCCRWICIVSSKGTCHIFLLSPFGGDATVQTSHSHQKDILSYPVSSGPWWSTSSFTLKEQQSFPLSPSTLTVVTRIKDTRSSLLQTMNVAAASATGMKMAPTGALAATFHTSIAQGHHDLHLTASSLEHLLVFTPTGFVVQHKLLPSAGTELSHESPKVQPGLHVHTQDAQDEVFRVNAEPVQWWDVCRRSDYPETGDYSLGTTLDGVEDPAIVDSPRMAHLEKETVGLNKSVKNDRIKAAERPKWYLSNAEVQMHSARYQIWQRSKISFHLMSPPRSQGSTCGELEIEKVPSHEVEIKEKDLLPVFDHFPSLKSPWFDRGVGLGYDTSASLVNHQSGDNEATVICHSNPASLSSTESSDGGSSRRVENLSDLDQPNVDKSLVATRQTLNDSSEEETGNITSGMHMCLPSEHFSTSCCVKDSTLNGFPSVLSEMTSSIRITDAAAKVSKSVGVKTSVDCLQVFEESYCNTPEGCSPIGLTQLAEVVTDALEASSAPCKKVEPEDDGVLGGLFEFTEEGYLSEPSPDGLCI